MDQRAATPSHHHISSYIFDVRQANSPGCSPYHQYMSIPLDNDDNGETAAGNRLALLVSLTYRSWCHADGLQQLTGQYFGGFYLGADRFKHINQATRLNLVGFFPCWAKYSGWCPNLTASRRRVVSGNSLWDIRDSLRPRFVWVSCKYWIDIICEPNNFHIPTYRLYLHNTEVRD